MDQARATNILESILGRFKNQGSEKLFYCPECGHHKRKLSINLDRGAFKCWVCDYRGKSIRRLVRKHGTYNNLKDWDEIYGRPNIANFDFLFAEKEEEVKVDVQMPQFFRSLLRKDLKFVDKEPFNYLANRGLSRQDIMKWKIGYCNSGEYKNRIVVPSFDDTGDLNYFIARSYRGDYFKYKNPKATKDVIFNELFIDWDKDLTIVEGVFDAINAGNAVPILGSTLHSGSNLLRKIVRNDTPCYIALDADASKKEREIIKTLLSYDVELYKIDTSGFEDVGTMPKDVFNERKAKAKFIDRDNYLLLDLLAGIK
jgi:transcription elongation factor Elf1